jgi:phosphatidylglycerophosphate synthase
VAGGIVDPIMDKLFVGSVAVTLLATGRLSLLATLLLGSRDLVELPIALWLAFDPRARRDRSNQLKANVFGKIVTVLQFTTVVAALAASRYVTLLAVSSGLAGVVAGATYWTLARRQPPAHVNHHGDPGSSWRGTQASPNRRLP